jgi:hypothetical protein
MILFPEALRTVTGEINVTKLPLDLSLTVGAVADGIAIIVGKVGVALAVAAGTGVGALLRIGWFRREATVEGVGLCK